MQGDILSTRRTGTSGYGSTISLGDPIFIAVFVDPEKTDLPIQDGSAAVENMMSRPRAWVGLSLAIFVTRG